MDAPTDDELRPLTVNESGEDPTPRPALWREFLVALFSVFLSVSNGISLGSVLFPHNQSFPNIEFVSIGMSIGLITSATCNLALALGSQMPHSVGGPIMPVVPFMAAYFRDAFGPHEPYLCLLCVPLMTLFIGVLAFTLGFLRFGDVIRACPLPLFAGFMAGIGLQLLQLALHMMYPDFVAIIDPGSREALFTREMWILCGPGVAAGIIVFSLPKCVRAKWLDDFLLPLAVLALGALFYMILALTGTSVAEARAGGWLFNWEIPSTIDCTRLWRMLAVSITDTSVPRDKVLHGSFVVACLKAFAICLLPFGENLLCASRGTKSDIDFNKELRVLGLANVLSGAVGGMPATSVGSCTVTCHRLGARTRYFSWFQVVLSFLVFVIGDYVIALTPKMVLALIFVWLGILFLDIFVWKYFGEVSHFQFGIIVVTMLIMIAVSVEAALVFGLVACLVDHMFCSSSSETKSMEDV